MKMPMKTMVKSYDFLFVLSWEHVWEFRLGFERQKNQMETSRSFLTNVLCMSNEGHYGVKFIKDSVDQKKNSSMACVSVGVLLQL